MYKVPFGRGLVLRRAASDSGTYKRVGTFNFRGAVMWRKMRTEQTILSDLMYASLRLTSLERCS